MKLLSHCSQITYQSFWYAKQIELSYIPWLFSVALFTTSFFICFNKRYRVSWLWLVIKILSWEVRDLSLNDLWPKGAQNLPPTSWVSALITRLFKVASFCRWLSSFRHLKELDLGPNLHAVLQNWSQHCYTISFILLLTTSLYRYLRTTLFACIVMASHWEFMLNSQFIVCALCLVNLSVSFLSINKFLIHIMCAVLIIYSANVYIGISCSISSSVIQRPNYNTFLQL